MNPTTVPVLYHSEMSVCAAKVRILLADKAVAWESRLLNLRDGDAQAPDYVRLNPNKVVPTLVCGEDVVIESNVILEYVEDRWPASPRRPSDPGQAARMRLWLRRLDDGIHAAAAVASVCIALRHQFLRRSPEDVQRWLDGIIDPARRARSKAAIELGMDAPHFADAVIQLTRLLDDFEQRLAQGRMLAGDGYSLADIAYSPYMLRLDHLGFEDVIRARPHAEAWKDRLFARAGFRDGVIRWLNAAALELFERERPAAAARISEIVARTAGGSRD